MPQMIAFRRFGGPEMLELIEVERPIAAPGEVVVQVAASAVNPTDLAFLNGVRAPADLQPPYSAGMDFTGTVLSVAPDVTRIAVGDKVMGVASPRSPKRGAHAQEIAISANSLAVLSPEIDLIAAASVPMNGLTALLSLDALNLPAGASVMITGATGMLGSIASEIAAQRGLHVITSAAEKDHAFLRQIGIKTILPRSADIATELRRIAPEGIQGVIDTALISNDFSDAIRSGATVVSPRAAYQITDPRLRPYYVQVTSATQDHKKLDTLAALLSAKQLTPRIAKDGLFAAKDAANAFAMVATGGYRGRVIIKF